MSYSDGGMESGGEDYYISDNDDDRHSDDGFAIEDDSTTNQSQSQVSYVILKEEDIRKRQDDDIERVSSFLSISHVESIVLLLHYRWSVSKIEDEWFTDEDRVRKLVGIFKEPVVNYGRGVDIVCGICFDSFGFEEIVSVSCGHPYCTTCWSGFIQSKINDGLGCLVVKCPEPSCTAAVGQDMILEYTKGEEIERYFRFLLKSYVEGSGKKIKWCPSPGCGYAINLGSRSETYDVSCLCSNTFCWNCTEEVHRPLDCETVAKWIFKNNDESENTTWILANTKPCPKCKRQIEKNQGCNHMTCSRPCSYEFCWICLDPFTSRHVCNRYTHDHDETETRRQRAKNALDRYTHYFERWANNQKSRDAAMKDLEKLQTVQLKELSIEQSIPETQLQFTVEAWLQVIECRRVLKWTYAYGYYLPESERAKRDFFEYLQGEAERALEKLHHCAEKELNEFNSGSGVPNTNFDDFRRKLVGLTKVNKTYFENLVKAWENGLAEEGLNESYTTNSSSKRQKMDGMVKGGAVATD